MIEQKNTPRTIEAALEMFADAGITPNSEDIARAYELQEQRRAQLEAQYAAQERNKPKTTALVEAFNTWYPKFLQALLGIGDVVITLTQTLLIAFGIPVVLIMLLIVEQQRVFHGISLFEVHEWLAAFSATSLVTLNLILEILISWLEHKNGYVTPAKYKFSFYHVWQWFKYVIGWDKSPQQISPAYRFRAVLRIVTFSILTLALAGSMRSVIEATEGTWLQAINHIFTQSTGLQMITWIGGFLFAFAVVKAAQSLSHYVAEKVIEIIAVMQSNSNDKAMQIAELTGTAGAYYLISRLKDVKRENRRRSYAADMPSVRNSSEQVYDLSNVQSVRNVRNSSEQSPSIRKALHWLEQNPNNELSVRESARAAKVSATTMHTAMKIYND